MGSDYYAYTVIGVRAKNHIKNEQRTINFKKGVYNKQGQELTEKRQAEWYEFLGKCFWQSYRYQGYESYVPDLKFSEDDVYGLQKYIGKLGLKWISYDYEYIGDDDVLGLVVTDYGVYKSEKTEATLKQLQEAWIKARELLKKIGIDEEPKLYTAFYHSY